MPSFEMIFEEEEDVLEVTFETFDETFSRTVALNDNIVIYTDLGLVNAWGITFYDYAQLLQVSETELGALESLEEANKAKILALLSRAPISHFLRIVDSNLLLAQVKAPSLEALIRGE
jgi:hypothetical protein